MAVTIITLLVILLQTSDVQHHSVDHSGTNTSTTTALTTYNSTVVAYYNSTDVYYNFTNDYNFTDH